jgi:hypothetical protein
MSETNWARNLMSVCPMESYIHSCCARTVPAVIDASAAPSHTRYAETKATCVVPFPVRSATTNDRFDLNLCQEIELMIGGSASVERSVCRTSRQELSLSLLELRSCLCEFFLHSLSLLKLRSDFFRFSTSEREGEVGTL